MGIFGVFMTNIDSVIIGIFMSTKDLGLYAAAQKPISMLYLIPGFLYTGLLPFISKFVNDKDPKKIYTILKKSLILSLGIAIPIVVGGLIIAGPMIRVAYGAEYINATMTFQLLLLTLIPIFPGTILSATLLAEDKQKVFIKSSILGASTNIILDLLLIPTYGLAGSAIATIFAQIIANAILFIEIRKNYKINLLRDLAKMIVATCLMAAFCIVAKILMWPIILIIPLSAILYFGLLIIMREELVNDLKKGFII
jgi:O-antigen/teichoic acid export membrane protein